MNFDQIIMNFDQIIMNFDQIIMFFLPDRRILTAVFTVIYKSDKEATG